MATAFALLSALSYGVGDYLAGSGSRSWDSRLVAGVTQAIGVLVAVIAVLAFPGAGPALGPMLWGAASGVGSTVGVLALYRGLAVADMSVVAPVSGVVTCIVPAVVGLLLGDRVSSLQLVGILVALPAVALVARGSSSAAGPARPGLLLGLAAGAGFGLLFVALDRAGTRHGAWPLLVGQVILFALILPFARAGLRRARRPTSATLAISLLAGILSGAANLLYLLATRHGELAIIGVLSSLYPAGTVLIARVRLGERWRPVQRLGLLASLLAVVLVAS